MGALIGVLRQLADGLRGPLAHALIDDLEKELAGSGDAAGAAPSEEEKAQ